MTFAAYIPVNAMTSQQPSSTAAGIALMLVGIFLFALNDALGKWLVATYSVGQVLLIRSLAALAVLAPFAIREGAGAFIRVPRPGIQLLRAVFATGEVALFYWALTSLPLADVMTYYLAGPIYVTAMAATLLREPVGWRRWSAVIVGFGGVIIALQPSADSLSVPALVALVGSFSFSLLMICTRLVRGTSDVVLVSWQMLGALAFGAVVAPFTWTPMSAADLGLLLLLGIVAMGAHMCINRSLIVAPPSVVVPYQYTTIVWAILLGFWFFGDVPQTAMLIGCAVIIAAGIYIFMRERRLAHPPFPPVAD